MNDQYSPLPGNKFEDIKMVQSILLVWLDNNIDKNNSHYDEIIKQLRQVINNVNIFTNVEECIQFLDDIRDDKACVIISGSLGERIISDVHQISQVDSILIFCHDKKYHKTWAKKWAKIQGILTEVDLLCHALTRTARQYEQDVIPISFVPINADLNTMDPSFAYTQLLKEILISIRFEQQHTKEFFDSCRNIFAGNNQKLQNIKNFELKYTEESPIYWYTRQEFLYPMLNRALRLMDVDVIVKSGFFINDLHRHIVHLHQKQFDHGYFSRSFNLYRGQGMQESDFKKLQKTQDGLLSFNSFLSTSIKPKHAKNSAYKSASKPNMVGILFVMTIHPGQSSTPFASIADVCYLDKQQDEFLFGMHSVFRINSIRSIDGTSKVFQVDLTLTSNYTDKHVYALTNQIREECFPDKDGWFRLGEVLRKMGQFSKAQQIYEKLLEKNTERINRASIYDQLGLIKLQAHEYKEAITLHKEALTIRQQSLPPNHSDLATSYSNIGNVYCKLGEYEQALSSHKKALEIRQQLRHIRHPDIASSYNEIGKVYYKMNNYGKALSSYEKALANRQALFPLNQSALATAYSNIGSANYAMGEYARALSSYNEALIIQEKILPANHLNLAKSYNNIALTYKQLGDYVKALDVYEQALSIRQQLLARNHRDLAANYNSIGLVHEYMKNYTKAYPFYEKAVIIGERSLSSSDTNLIMYKNNLSRLEKKFSSSFF